MQSSNKAQSRVPNRRYDIVRSEQYILHWVPAIEERGREDKDDG